MRQARSQAEARELDCQYPRPRHSKILLRSRENDLVCARGWWNLSLGVHDNTVRKNWAIRSKAALHEFKTHPRLDRSFDDPGGDTRKVGGSACHAYQSKRGRLTNSERAGHEPNPDSSTGAAPDEKLFGSRELRTTLAQTHSHEIERSPMPIRGLQLRGKRQLLLTLNSRKRQRAKHARWHFIGANFGPAVVEPNSGRNNLPTGPFGGKRSVRERAAAGAPRLYFSGPGIAPVAKQLGCGCERVVTRLSLS